MKKQCYCGVGGQAILEGIMMKNGDRAAVAVRMQDGSVHIDTRDVKSICGDSKAAKLPFLRGPINFIDSLVLGIRTIEESADLLITEEERAEAGTKEKKPGFWDKFLTEKQQKDIGTALTVLFAVVFSLGLFMVLPVFIAGLLRPLISSAFGISLLEGLLRVAMFVIYIWLISLMKDIRRVFMYHGAEHKCINCIEHGLPLTVENVRACSKQHKRCGTSFMLFVMIISIFVSLFLPHEVIWLRALSRLLVLPVVVSVSYEFIRLAGRSDSAFANILSKPGLWLQGLTTREPDDTMIEVGIASVEAVFDWKAWQAENTEEQT